MRHGTWNNPVTPPDVYSVYYALGNRGPRGIQYTAADGTKYRVTSLSQNGNWIYAINDDDPAWLHSAMDWQTLKRHLDAGAPR